MGNYDSDSDQHSDMDTLVMDSRGGHLRLPREGGDGHGRTGIDERRDYRPRHRAERLPAGTGLMVQRSASGTAFVQLDLRPQQCVILG